MNDNQLALPQVIDALQKLQTKRNAALVRYKRSEGTSKMIKSESSIGTVDANDECESCTERPIWSEARENGYKYCEECSQTTTCSAAYGMDLCERALGYSAYEWDRDTCESCQQYEAKREVAQR
jgi:hypothetical protein